MAVPKVILFYVFAPLPDPDAVRLWQRELCERLNLRGRILLSPHGINGTLGGELDALKRYLRVTKEYPAFRTLDVKWSEGSGLNADNASLDFPRLSVKVRDEIVSFGAPDELVVDADGVVGGGTRLDPEGLHALVEERDDLVFFDGRNRFEANIGRFRDAVVPDVANTSEFVDALDSGAYDHLKGPAGRDVLHRRHPVRGALVADASRADSRRSTNSTAGSSATARHSATTDCGKGRSTSSTSEAPRTSATTPPSWVAASTCGTATSRMRNCTDPACREQLVVCEGCDAATCAAHAA